MNYLHPFSTVASLKKLLQIKRESSLTDCFLIDTPIHKNVGDLAIAYAERQFIESQTNNRFAEITALELDYCEKEFASIIPTNKTILVHGGGFLGSLWPNEEERFRRILSAFSSHRIIVFPQTVTFNLKTKTGKRYMKESQLTYSAHPNLTICVRDKMSHELLLDLFPKIKTALIPDMVLQLKIKNISNINRKGILLCMRDDHEKALSEAEEKKLSAILSERKEAITRTDMSANVPPSTKAKSEKIVDEKLSEFRKSKIVITDRLHGMIFSALTGTPCIALNNSNKKVEAVYQWIDSLEYIHCARSIDELKVILSRLDLSKTYSYKYEITQPYFAQLSTIITNRNNNHTCL